MNDSKTSEVSSDLEKLLSLNKEEFSSMLNAELDLKIQAIRAREEIEKVVNEYKIEDNNYKLK